MNDAEYYASAMERVKVARELRSELLRACPSDRRIPDAARANVAARAALRTACEIIEHTPRPKDQPARYFEGHRDGMIEAAMRIISAIETEMYDPRAYPERYGIRVDSESGGD